MKNRAVKYFIAVLYLFAIVAFSGIFSSCSASIGIKAKEDKSSTFDFNMSMGKSISDTIVSLTSGLNEISGQKSGESKSVIKDIISEKQVKSAFANSDFTGVTCTYPDDDSISLTGTLSSPDNQKALLDKDGVKLANIVTCTSSTLTVLISPETIAQIVSSLPEESRSYLDLLMAPVFTGDNMSSDEYADLIAAVYGDNIAKEIKKASLKVTLECPQGKTIRKSSLSGTDRTRTTSTSTVFSIPLLDFLTLKESQTFSIAW